MGSGSVGLSDNVVGADLRVCPRPWGHVVGADLRVCPRPGGQVHWSFYHARQTKKIPESKDPGTNLSRYHPHYKTIFKYYFITQAM